MGKMHKKKIAEYAAAEEEKSENSDNPSGSIEENGNQENIETNGENGDTVKSGKKRKAASGGKSNGTESPPKKGKRGAPKKKGAQKKKTAAASVPKEEVAGDEEEYEVKEIVGHRIENGKSMFLVRWKGYTKDDDTWEAEDTLSCNALIEKFKKKNEKAGTPAKSSKRGRKGNPPAKVSTEEYEVEKIINYAEEKDQRMFLIRWKGYKAKYDTWEPESNLNCSEIIEKFMERMQKQKNANFKELREEPKKTKRLLNETEPRYKIRSDRSSKRASKKRVYYGDSDD